MFELTINGKTFADGRGGQTEALGKIKLKVKNGEFVCAVGPSGCGKSTLLNIIANLIKPNAGEVKFRSFGGAGSPRIGYVFQEPRLVPWMTVLDNVLLVTDKGPEAMELATELLSEMRLGKTADHYPNELSGGMQRRVALARAFVIRPNLLLMDEPFVSLDQPLAESLRRLLLRLLAEHPTSVVFVSHDLAETIALGQRILFFSLSPGRIILEKKIPKQAKRGGDFQKQLLEKHPRLLLGEL